MIINLSRPMDFLRDKDNIGLICVGLLLLITLLLFSPLGICKYGCQSGGASTFCKDIPYSTCLSNITQAREILDYCDGRAYKECWRDWYEDTHNLE